jgi:hypothetical protein
MILWMKMQVMGDTGVCWGVVRRPGVVELVIGQRVPDIHVQLVVSRWAGVGSQKTPLSTGVFWKQ